jgi:alpha-amylase
MKNIIVIALMMVLSSPLFAKKVKFMVDMRNEILNANGVHIAGDFQTAAGYAGGDWNTGTTAMAQEVSDTNIYSVVVDIPAFAKYEFKYINGIFGYETEFVPLECRVGYNFVDSRWFWLDSLSNDTTVTAPVIFGANAPSGKYLVRLKVDMQNEAGINTGGVHVAGFFNGFNSAANYMYSFDGNVHELIAYVDTGTSATPYEFIYFNGTTSESVPTACATINNRRGVNVLKDTVMDAVCFNECVSCLLAGITESRAGNINVFPNPVIDKINIENGNEQLVLAHIRDLSGRIVQTAINPFSFVLLEKEKFYPGIYLLECITASGDRLIKKIVIE